MPLEIANISTLKKRAEFLYIAQGKKAHGQFLSMQARAPKDENAPRDTLRFGITASKKVGNAVKRNRAKRRLRAALLQTLPKYAVLGHDYVAIARPQTCVAEWQALISDIEFLIQKLNQKKPR
jgi:ribonuclease P protein component